MTPAPIHWQYPDVTRDVASHASYHRETGTAIFAVTVASKDKTRVVYVRARCKGHAEKLAINYARVLLGVPARRVASASLVDAKAWCEDLSRGLAYDPR